MNHTKLLVSAIAVTLLFLFTHLPDAFAGGKFGPRDGWTLQMVCSVNPWVYAYSVQARHQVNNQASRLTAQLDRALEQVGIEVNWAEAMLRGADIPRRLTLQIWRQVNAGFETNYVRAVRVEQKKQVLVTHTGRFVTVTSSEIQEFYRYPCSWDTLAGPTAWQYQP